jgi:hypothetical protein
MNTYAYIIDIKSINRHAPADFGSEGGNIGSVSDRSRHWSRLI